MLEVAIIGAVGCVLLTAAAYDLATLTIPNWITLALVALFPLAGIVGGFAWADWGWHLLVGFLALSAGVTVFAFGYAGGGDAKLFAAGALYMGLGGIGPFILAIALCGGALALAFLFLRRLPLPVFLLSQPWMARLYAKGQGVPYGVAIAAGALIVLPNTNLFAGMMV
jgi:prepilin peptidase CpaA